MADEGGKDVKPGEALTISIKDQVRRGDAACSASRLTLARAKQSARRRLSGRRRRRRRGRGSDSD